MSQNMPLLSRVLGTAALASVIVFLLMSYQWGRAAESAGLLAPRLHMLAGKPVHLCSVVGHARNSFRGTAAFGQERLAGARLSLFSLERFFIASTHMAGNEAS